MLGGCNIRVFSHLHVCRASVLLGLDVSTFVWSSLIQIQCSTSSFGLAVDSDLQRHFWIKLHAREARHCLDLLSW